MDEAFCVLCRKAKNKEAAKMTKHGHRAQIHGTEIKNEREAYEAENSRERGKIKEETEKHREREQQLKEAKKYEAKEKE